MPETNGHAALSSPDSRAPRAALDLDALMPTAPPHRVRIDGVEYAVRQIIHLNEQEEADLRVLEQRLDDAIKSKDDDSYERARRASFDLSFWLVRALVPDLPESVRRKIRLDQAWAIAGVGRLSVSENPPSADTGAGSSAAAESSTPVSADSTAASPVPSPV
jgi:hypothetical protein